MTSHDLAIRSLSPFAIGAEQACSTKERLKRIGIGVGLVALSLTAVAGAGGIVGNMVHNWLSETSVHIGEFPSFPIGYALGAGLGLARSFITTHRGKEDETPSVYQLVNDVRTDNDGEKGMRYLRTLRRVFALG